MGFRRETQFCLDILDDLRRGGGGERQHGHTRQLLADTGYLKVGGAEVVAPLGDAVGLVDGDETHVHVTQFRLEKFGSQALRRDIQDLDVAEDTVLQGDDDFLAGEAGVDGGGTDAQTAEIVYLVLHQGNERGDDDARAFLSQCRHLEGDGLAATRGHQSQCIMATGDGLDDLLLNAAEVIIAPVLLKNPSHSA